MILSNNPTQIAWEILEYPGDIPRVSLSFRPSLPILGMRARLARIDFLFLSFPKREDELLILDVDAGCPDLVNYLISEEIPLYEQSVFRGKDAEISGTLRIKNQYWPELFMSLIKAGVSGEVVIAFNEAVAELLMKGAIPLPLTSLDLT